MWYAVVMVVDIQGFFILSTCLKTCGLVVNDRVDGKDNHEDETTEFLNITITSFRMIGLFLLLLAGVLLLLFSTWWWRFFPLQTTLWCQEPWFSQPRSYWRTLKWRDTSWCHHLTWCPPSKCPCHPQCRRPSTHVYLMWSDMLKTYIKNSHVTHHHHFITRPSWTNSNLSNTS